MSTAAERHAEAKRLFLEARQKPATERESFLKKACAEDPALREEVSNLLERLEADGGDAAELETELAPIRLSTRAPKIANYRVLQKLGEGGMGEVYEAEQLHPVRRRVALKVLKGGLATREVVARFELERQALAMMNHPHIAQVFEAGATDLERPYFAMELVRGESITHYCDRYRLTTRARLELFVKVCLAVQHAHQKGLIHRDLKPSNVLVTIANEEAVPKIIDFGVAKATAQSLTERTLFTELGQWIGTPEYMSPEQAEMGGLDIDTRTDVYALGILLYELLVGVRPFDSESLRRASFDEIRRRIREDDPTRPSTKVSGLGEALSAAAGNRQVPVGTLADQLRGDLDWIVMKALEKDRTRRYASPSEFAADIERHLTDEPVLACPPSTFYSMKKFARRNRLAVIAGGSVVAALLLGLAMTGLALRRANDEARRANQVADYLQEVFEDLNPYGGRTTTSSEERLNEAVERLETELAGQDLVRGRLMFRIGTAYRHLDRFAPGEELLLRARVLLAAELGEDHPEVITTLGELAWLLWEGGQYRRGQEVLEEALELQRQRGDPESRVLSELEGDLGHFTWGLGDYRGAEEILTAVQDRLEAQGETATYDLARNLFLQGILFNNNGEYRRARSALERSMELRLKTLSPDHVRVGWTLRTLARTQFLQGDYDLALESGERAREIMEGAFGLEHSDIAYALETLGTTYRLLGDFSKARPLLERSLALRERALGSDHVELGLSLAKLAELHLDLEEHESATGLLERNLDLDRRYRPPGHPVMARTLNALSRARLQSGRLPEALALQLEALKLLEGRESQDPHDGYDPLLGPHLAHLGVLRRESGDLAQARGALERALDIQERQLGREHPRVADTLCELARLEGLEGRNEVAGRRFGEAVAIYEVVLPADHPALARCLRRSSESR